MSTYSQNIGKIGESFINGNISWVRDEIKSYKNRITVYNDVLTWLEEINEETAQDFRRLIPRGI